MALKQKGKKPKNPVGKPWWPHSSGYWAVKIYGKLTYLCRWSCSQREVAQRYKEAIAAIDEAIEANRAGVTVPDDHLLVRQLVAGFLRDRQDDVNDGRLSLNTLIGYRTAAKIVTKALGFNSVESLGPDHFADFYTRITGYSPKQRDHIVNLCKMVFHWGQKSGYINRMPQFGSRFRLSNVRQRASWRASKPLKFWQADQIRKMYDAANDSWKAMILLGINCAYTQVDCACLPVAFRSNDVDTLSLAADIPFVSFRRPKTLARRKCTLWPETVAALQKIIGDRNKGLVFLTRKNQPLVHFGPKQARCDAVCISFGRLKKKVFGDDPSLRGVGFSALRSTCNTVAIQNPDLRLYHQAAINWIMGHTMGGGALSKMTDLYFQDIDPKALQPVTDYVRNWLWDLH